MCSWSILLSQLLLSAVSALISYINMTFTRPTLHLIRQFSLSLSLCVCVCVCLTHSLSVTLCLSLSVCVCVLSVSGEMNFIIYVRYFIGFQKIVLGIDLVITG